MINERMATQLSHCESRQHYEQLSSTSHNKNEDNFFLSLILSVSLPLLTQLKWNIRYFYTKHTHKPGYTCTLHINWVISLFLMYWNDIKMWIQCSCFISVKTPYRLCDRINGISLFFFFKFKLTDVRTDGIHPAIYVIVFQIIFLLHIIYYTLYTYWSQINNNNHN